MWVFNKISFRFRLQTVSVGRRSYGFTIIPGYHATLPMPTSWIRVFVSGLEVKFSKKITFPKMWFCKQKVTWLVRLKCVKFMQKRVSGFHLESESRWYCSQCYHGHLIVNIENVCLENHLLRFNLINTLNREWERDINIHKYIWQTSLIKSWWLSSSSSSSMTTTWCAASDRTHTKTHSTSSISCDMCLHAVFRQFMTCECCDRVVSLFREAKVIHTHYFCWPPDCSHLSI